MKPMAIILAGGLKQPALQQMTRRHVMTLPIGDGRSLFDAWIESLHEALGERGRIRVLVSDVNDAEQLRMILAARSDDIDTEIMIDPSPWRGTAGVIKDCLACEPRANCVLVVEGACLPAAGLGVIMNRLDLTTQVVIGATSRSEPAGVYAADAEVFSLIPDVGYIDFKEQFIGRAITSAKTVRMVAVGTEVLRLRTWESYRNALQSDHAPGTHDHAPGTQQMWDQAHFRNGRSTFRRGFSIIEEGAVVDDSAILNESVVLRGARVGAGAILSRSLITNGHTVGANERVIDVVKEAIVEGHADSAAMALSPNGAR